MQPGHVLRSLTAPPLQWGSAALLLLLAACTASPTPTPAASPTTTPLPATAALPSPTPVPTVVPGVLYVDAAQRLEPVSPFVCGTNYGPWITVPFDLLPRAEAAGITYLCFPGGNWGDQHNLRGYQIDQFISVRLALKRLCFHSATV